MYLCIFILRKKEKIQLLRKKNRIDSCCAASMSNDPVCPFDQLEKVVCEAAKTNGQQPTSIELKIKMVPGCVDAAVKHIQRSVIAENKERLAAENLKLLDTNDFLKAEVKSLTVAASGPISGEMVLKLSPLGEREVCYSFFVLYSVETIGFIYFFDYWLSSQAKRRIRIIFVVPERKRNSS